MMSEPTNPETGFIGLCALSHINGCYAARAAAENDVTGGAANSKTNFL